jgi:hypothetical protein
VNLTTIRTEVRERIGEISADFFTNAEVDRAINEAVRRFAFEEKWPFLLTEWSSTLDGGDDELTLPDNISASRFFNLSIDSSSLATARILKKVDAREGFSLRHVYTANQGIPMWYYIARSNQNDDESPPVVYTARVIPTPDVDYDVDALYMAVPIEMATASDEPMIPEEYQDAIPAWAAGKLFLKEQAISQKASEQFGIYGKVLEQARLDMKSYNSDEVVAWGRREPLRGPWQQTMDPRFRTAQNLG